MVIGDYTTQSIEHTAQIMLNGSWYQFDMFNGLDQLRTSLNQAAWITTWAELREALSILYRKSMEITSCKYCTGDSTASKISKIREFNTEQWNQRPARLEYRLTIRESAWVDQSCWVPPLCLPSLWTPELPSFDVRNLEEPGRSVQNPSFCNRF